MRTPKLVPEANRIQARYSKINLGTTLFISRSAVEEEKAKLGPGQTISLEKVTEIFHKLAKNARTQIGQS